MSEETKEWYSAEEVIACGLPYAPQSRSAVSRLVTRLRFEAPAKLKRAGRERYILIHISAIDPDRDPPAELHEPVFSRASGRLVHKVRGKLPPRRDGSRPTFDEIQAALLLLGYHA